PIASEPIAYQSRYCRLCGAMESSLCQAVQNPIINQDQRKPKNRSPSNQPDYASQNDLEYANDAVCILSSGMFRHSTLWLNPLHVGQFEFVHWTEDGHLRHSRFMGLREDKKAKDVRRE